MYKEYQPCALLSPYIDKYWEFTGNPEYGMRINILPDGCTDFIFTLGEATQAVNRVSDNTGEPWTCRTSGIPGYSVRRGPSVRYL